MDVQGRDLADAAHPAALEGVDLGDVGLRDALRELVAVAAYACDAPFAAVELVDEEGATVLAGLGLPEGAVPRATSFGAHAGREPGFLLVPDASADPRFREGRFVADEPRVRSYAGVPIRTRDGARIGAIGVMDREVRTLTPKQIATLEILANQVAMQLDLRRNLDTIVAAREALERSERRFRTLVEELPAVVYTDDARRGLEDIVPHYYSPPVEELLGYPKEAWLDDEELWTRSVHPDDLVWVEPLADAARRAGEPFTCEYRMIREDGEVIWVSERAVLVKDEEGHPLYWQGVWLDITDRKRAEAELEIALEREHLVNEHLRELGDLKDLLLHAVSHDLRSRITAVVGSATTLQMARGHLDRIEEADLTESIVRNGWRMQRLVTDLLDLDRLERGVLEPNRRPVDVGSRLSQIVADLDVGRNVVVEAAAVEAWVDPAHLERIVENLVLNAVEHTPVDATVWVRARRSEGELVLVVEDDGPGVPGGVKAGVFEAFRKGEGSRGLGIGLSLVARFAALYGGRAAVGDREGGGARFEVRLPDRAGIGSPVGRSA